VPTVHLPIRSPSDHQAHSGPKRDLAWFGYNVHVSETCDSDLPHLITPGATTDAPKTEREGTGVIYQALEARGLEPGRQVLDAG